MIGDKIGKLEKLTDVSLHISLSPMSVMKDLKMFLYCLSQIRVVDSGLAKLSICPNSSYDAQCYKLLEKFVPHTSNLKVFGFQDISSLKYAKQESFDHFAGGVMSTSHTLEVLGLSMPTISTNLLRKLQKCPSVSVI